MFRDDVDRLQTAIDYIVKHRSIPRQEVAQPHDTPPFASRSYA
jgi:hypothetical protein